MGPDLTYNGGETDAFVAKVDATGSALIYAGYIGGSESDTANGIDVDAEGNAYVAGDTLSAADSFPALGACPSIQNPAGSTTIYCSFEKC